jgi:septal ring factor EnvC (AmiA/AmiB activator)
MNEQIEKIIIAVLRYFIVFALGCLAAGVYAHIRQLEQVGHSNDRITELQREHDQRQRELEIRLGESERIIEGAREAVKRTGTSLAGDARNIREASRIIGDLYLQIAEIDRVLTGGDSPGGGGGSAGGAAD